ncbi:MAG: murein biosynthesis integral membrane protein MurJ [Candidatus Saelkia tenebricola]|nr:murein biosynthesis integral membrane protein MurJ [Candidatus Saelkia tenebricola]
MFKQILKKSFTIGGATLVSRILGFLRDILIAFFFGTTSAAQAFVVAFRLPNIWRSFVGEEAVNAAVVPVLSEYNAKKDLNTFWKVAVSLLKVSFLFLSLLALAGVALAPILVKIIAPGFSTDLSKYELCVRLTRLIFPYILLIGLTAMISGIVISQKIFWSYAWAPVILNISIISSLFIFNKRFGIYALAFGIIIGGILELMLQFFALGKAHPHKVKSPLIHPEFKRISKLLVPRFCGAGVYHINIFVDTILASLETVVGQGGIAALYYAQRFVQLPLAVFATSLATALLPFFSAQSIGKRTGELGANVLLSLRFVAFIMIPAALGFIVMSEEIIESVFQYGRFSSYSTAITSGALKFYALGLVFYAGIKILVATFYSLQDTLTPVKASLVALFINIVLSIILMFPMKISGLCLATSIAAACNFCMLFWILRKRIFLRGIAILRPVLKIIIAASLMSTILLFLKIWIKELIEIRVLNLLVLLVVGASSYLFIAIAFGIEEARSLLKWKKVK